MRKMEMSPINTKTCANVAYWKTSLKMLGSEKKDLTTHKETCWKALLRPQRRNVGGSL